MEVKIKIHLSILLAKYMNQNRKIFEFWMKHVFFWPNFTHKIKVLHSIGGKFLNALGISISHPCKIDGFLFQEWTITICGRSGLFSQPM
jgi:hypothetical protein